MANTIKIGNLDISAFKVGSDDCKVYLGDTLLYPSTPPPFQGKWLATYNGGTTSSAECDASSAITRGEINLTNLVSVEIGDCVTSIGDSSFYRCRSLTSVIIPNSVASINRRAFSTCAGITNIEIPSSVTYIGTQAFYNCTSLASITINATVPPTLDNQAIYGTTCPIYVPSGSVDAYKVATNWSAYASRIQAIPNS